LLYKAIVEIFSTLAKRVLTDGSTLMIAGGMDILPISAVALILVILAATIVTRKRGSYFKSFRARNALGNNRASDRFFESKRSPAMKPCPSCAEQLPLSALVCDACDYNFLAARPGRGQKLLPPPGPMTHEVPEQRIAAMGL
jgi:hypothetical protein